MVLPHLVVGVGSIVFPTPFMLILIEFLAEDSFLYPFSFRQLCKFKPACPKATVFYS
ncbi:Uncharacterized protein APZ42_005447, partial [Daphnia magna]